MSSLGVERNPVAFILHMASTDTTVHSEADIQKLFPIELSTAWANVTNLAKEISDRQSASIHMSLSDFSIRAKNGFEFILKKMKANTFVKAIVDKLPVRKERDIPATGFVKDAENAKVTVDSKKAIEDATRERGGHYRDERKR